MKYILRRFAFFLVTLWAAVTLNFLIPRLQPGDPAESIVRQITGEGQSASGQQLNPNQVKAVQVMLGIDTDQSMPEQYRAYWTNIIRGDFGISYTYFPYPVLDIIKDAAPWSIVMVLVTTAIGFTVGCALGAWSAWKRGSFFDSFMTIGSSMMGSVPYFWIALLLVWFFAFENQWLPQYGGYSDTTPGWNWAFFQDAFKHSLLPAISLLITAPIGWILGMRNAMIQDLGSDYARLARAKGLKQSRIAWMYGARVAILPNVTALALSLGGLLGGVLLVEEVFAYPGMGKLMIEAVNNRDYPMMQTIFLFSTILTLIANLVADLLYGVLDPRVRRGG